MIPCRCGSTVGCELCNPPAYSMVTYYAGDARPHCCVCNEVDFLTHIPYGSQYVGLYICGLCLGRLLHKPRYDFT